MRARDRPRNARGQFLAYVPPKPVYTLTLTGEAVCDQCGALVGDSTVHDTWHARLDPRP